jgi:hemerythrin-like domain-containing protein
VAASADPPGVGVCTYCGCRAISLIGRFSAEHEAIVNATGVLRRAAGSGDLLASRVAAGRLAALLDPHTRSEERSLFAEMRTDSEFTEHVAGLCQEHDEINLRLAAVVEGALAGASGLERLLRRHIDKEENGLFPAAAIALDGPAWERVAALA